MIKEFVFGILNGAPKALSSFHVAFQLLLLAVINYENGQKSLSKAIADTDPGKKKKKNERQKKRGKEKRNHQVHDAAFMSMNGNEKIRVYVVSHSNHLANNC